MSDYSVEDAYADGQTVARVALDRSPMSLDDLITNISVGLSTATSETAVAAYRGALDTLIDFREDRSDR